MGVSQPGSLPGMFESLEQRRHLSATLDQGLLTIAGTHKNDHISLEIDARTPDQVTVTVDGFVRRFALAAVDSIEIDAGQGNDLVEIDPGKAKLNMPTTITGSGGDDTLIGGTGKDRIYGGAGDDQLKGNNASDILYGESGDDTLDGGNGNDHVDGGDGNDSLIGGAGTDSITGDAGDDFINSKDGGTDSVNGGDGFDSANTDKIDGVTSVENIVNPRVDNQP